PALPGLAVVQNPVNPRSQFGQQPQLILNGRQTQSPFFTNCAAGPLSTTSPRFSCPSTFPSSTSVRPSNMCRSDPQIFVATIFTMASVGFSIFGSGTFSILTLRGPR